MRTLVLTLITILFSSLLHAQHICETDHLHNQLLESSENQRAKFSWMNERILDGIIARRSGGGEQELLTIPTVVHVIHQDGQENISIEQVEQGITWLNEAYSNTGSSFNPDGIAIPIEFCLAKSDPDGNFSPGVNYISDPLTEMLVPSQNIALKDLSRWDPESYFNIWVVRSIVREDDSPGVAGYSSFPDSHGTDNDGVVIEADFFGSTEAGNSVLIHESGHYLGLFHTFQEGCPNDDCLTSGDRVCDTPPDNNLFGTFCFDGTNSCSTDEDDTSLNNPFRSIDLGGLGDQFDQQTNYMDYTGILCFDIFTAGQSERMLAALTEVRSSLFEDDKCVPPCDNPITLDVSSTADIINVGESITFTNSSTNFTELQWYVDGSPTETSNEYIYTPTTQGSYLIELELTNGEEGCYQFVPFEITVICPITVDVSPSATNISQGGTVEFQTSITGGSSYEWFVDNESIGTEETLSYTFNEVGISSVQLVVSNGVCQVSSQVWNISIGSCTSGNEHNIWHWFNPIGNGYGFDFNANPVELVSEDPMLSEGHCKATICDESGNLLFVSTGEGVYDRNYDLVENGAGLSGSISSHFGTMFLQNPGNEDEYYVFTTSSNEQNFSNGLRYSIINATANDGLGQVTADKNILIEVTGTEHMNIVKHCNLRDKWLIFYDIPENKMKAYLISDSGINPTPVETTIDFALNSYSYSSPIKPSPQGNQLIFDNYLMNFNQATGEVENFIDLDLSSIVCYDFSPNGKILYTLSGDIDLEFNQYDLTLPAELIPENPYTIDLTIADYGKDMQKGIDDILYFEQTIPGTITTITSPNLLGDAMDFNDGVFFANSLINSFGNFYHAYIAGQDLLIDGDEIICAGTEHEFSIFGSECITSDIDWEFSGDGQFIINEDATVSATFPDVGEAILIAKTAADCGEITDTLNISIIQGPPIDLGPDLGYCDSDPIINLEMSSDFDFYLWSTGSTEQSISLTSPEPQIIEARGYYNGCFITDEIEILGELSGVIDLGPDLELCEGDVAVLDAGPGYSDYLWQDGSTGQTFTAFLGGTYSVTATNPCAAFDALFIDECGQNISVSEQDIHHSFDVYPNPISDNFTLEFNSSRKEPLKMSILDMAGRLVMSNDLDTNLGLNSMNFDISHLAAGDYLLRIQSENFEWNKTILVNK